MSWGGFEGKKKKVVFSSMSCSELCVSCEPHGCCCRSSCRFALVQWWASRSSTNSSQISWDILSPGLEQEAALALQFPWLPQESLSEALARHTLLAVLNLLIMDLQVTVLGCSCPCLQSCKPSTSIARDFSGPLFK